MTREQRQLGHATLELLARAWCIAILRELASGALRPSELERRLPGAPHAALMRTLSALHSKGIVTHERYNGLLIRAQYALTECGRLIFDVLAAAERWGSQWVAERSQDGRLAVSLIGDELTREILLALASEPIPPKQLGRRVSASRWTLQRRLARLVDDRVLLHHARGVYELTESARQLAVVEIAAARWEWKWARPEGPVAAEDVAGVLRLFAPVAQVPVELGGICRMHVDDEANGPDVFLAARDGRVAVLAPAPGAPPEASCHAPPPGWCDALLLRRWSAISATGNQNLTDAMLSSVSAAMFA
ncbi:MAG: winged helix-turn-helix transcriptional regulator [Solirubrobacteraceae bacterium]